MKDLMIDLETWGNGNNAVMVQFGGCYFDRMSGEIGETLKINISPESSLRAGFEVDASTIQWWLRQSDNARKSVTEGHAYDVTEGLVLINNFIKKAKQIWSHATFDYVILMNHFQRLGVKPSTHYRDARDIRTLVDLAGGCDWGKYKRVGTHHDALDDCKYQVAYCVDCISKVVKQFD